MALWRKLEKTTVPEMETQPTPIKARDLFIRALINAEVDAEKTNWALNLFDQMASQELVKAIEDLVPLKEELRHASPEYRIIIFGAHLKHIYYNEALNLRQILKRASLTNEESCAVQNALTGIAETCVFVNPEHPYR